MTWELFIILKKLLSDNWFKTFKSYVFYTLIYEFIITQIRDNFNTAVSLLGIKRNYMMSLINVSTVEINKIFCH